MVLTCSAIRNSRLVTIGIAYGDDTTLYPERVHQIQVELKNKLGVLLRQWVICPSHDNSTGEFCSATVLGPTEQPFTLGVVADTDDGRFTDSCPVVEAADKITTRQF